MLNGDLNQISGRSAFDAMRRGDASAKAVVDGYVHYLCVGITSIVNIFQPEVLCVGGGISREGEAVMAPVRAYVGKYGYARGKAAAHCGRQPCRRRRHHRRGAAGYREKITPNSLMRSRSKGSNSSCGFIH
jgi:predicted NBD/HSP70 family sugar kinase